MTVVEIISKEECHLCDVAREVVLKVRKTAPFELRQTKIREGESLYETYGQRVPVILVDGEFAFQFKVSESQLLTKLRSLGS
jgi:hypothetical protein